MSIKVLSGTRFHAWQQVGMSALTRIIDNELSRPLDAAHNRDVVLKQHVR